MGGGGVNFMGQQPIFVGSPLSAMVAKEAKLKKFSGHAEDWPDFRFRWTEYVQRLARGPTADGDLLSLLISSVNETDGDRLRLLRGTGMISNFQQAWDLLEKENSSGSGNCARQKFEEVRLNYKNDLTMEDWKRFKKNFLMLRNFAKEVTDADAYRI